MKNLRQIALNLAFLFVIAHAVFAHTHISLSSTDDATPSENIVLLLWSVFSTDLGENHLDNFQAKTKVACECAAIILELLPTFSVEFSKLLERNDLFLNYSVECSVCIVDNSYFEVPNKFRGSPSFFIS